MNELTVFDNKIDALTIFTDKEKVDEILQKIRDKATSFKPDLSTATSRKEIASVAYKVAQSKRILDKAGKELVGGWKEKAQKVDLSRKEIRNYLDQLRDEVRQPLTNWELAEKERQAKEKEIAEYNAAFEEAIKENDLFNKARELARREEIIREKEEAAKAKAAAEEERKKAEELRVANEEAQKKRDERLKQKAREKAQQEAEQKAAAIKKEAEQRLKDEKDEKEKAVREKIIAEERAKAEKEIAVRKALAEQEATARAKQEAKDREIKRKADEEKQRSEDESHRKEINNIILRSLIANGIEEGIAKKVIILAASGHIAKLRIEY